MPGKNTIKFVRSLKEKKERYRYGLFIVEGDKAVKELIGSSRQVHSLYATSEWISENRGEIPGNTYCVSSKTLERMSLLKTPNRVVAVAHIPRNNVIEEEFKESLTLLLDTIQDPGNMGTLIRLCDWFGIARIICSENCADIYNPKVVQATMGSIFRIRAGYTDLRTFIGRPENRGMPVYGTFSEGASVYDQPLSKRGFIVLGNESKGISPEIEEITDQRLTIPPCISGNHKPESLNVAIAGAIIISEFRRKHPCK